MLSTNLRYNPPNLTQLINDLPRSVRGVAVEEASRYLVGDGSRGLSHYPNYSFVSRTAAYGRPFQSDRQRRKFFAMLRNGEILPGFPRRTGRLQRGWTISYSGVSSRITNVENYAGYVVGDPGQARLNEMGGWRRIGLIIASNENGMVQAADRAAQRVIREMGL
jgi:hypothetical protein